MHIAMNGWFWNQPQVGSGQYVQQLMIHLRKLDPQLKLTLVMPAASQYPIPQGVDVVVTGGNVNSKWGKVWFEQRTFPAVVQQLKADIAHVPYWGTPLSVSARLVTSVLDVAPLEYPQYAGSFAAKLYTSLVTAAARGSAQIITLSEAAKPDIVRHLNVPEDSITPIHLGIDERYHPRMGAEGDAAIKQKYGLPDVFVLGGMGFDYRKNVKELLMAYTFVSQGIGERVPLVLAGKEPAWGSSPVFPDLRALAAELEIEDLIQWIGFVDEADKPALYRLASVFVFPSLYEGFGLPVLEAMASGTPVIAKEIPVMQELVGDGAFLVRDERKLAGAIIALLEQPSFRQSLVNQGLAQTTRYTWRKTAKETLAVYHEVMARP